MTYQDLQKVNSTIKTTNIKGKNYAEVNERIKAFRMLYPEGFIETTLLSFDDGVVVMRAEVGFYDNGNRILLGTGTAYEKEGSSTINRTSAVENGETSAVGRALGMVGIGIDTSVASYEEVSNAIKQQEAESRIVPESPICPQCGKEITDVPLKNGGVMSAQEVFSKYGRCAECVKNASV